MTDEAHVRSLLVRARNLLSQPPHWFTLPSLRESRHKLEADINDYLHLPSTKGIYEDQSI
jgi:hypothetical protein